MSALARRLKSLMRVLRDPAVPGEGEIVALDLETSSLDPKIAEILAIGAVPIRDRRVVRSESFERIVRSDAPVDREAVKYHRLRPTDVAEGTPATRAAREFVEWLGNRPVIGYCVSFDCAMLDRVLREGGGEGFQATRFDLREMYRRRKLHRNPHHAPQGPLDEMLADLGVPVTGRHTALGDAISVGMAYLALRHGGH
jgi:DNA polymerase-3 subunit epsilon